MVYVLWTFACLILYIGGLIILIKVTPLLDFFLLLGIIFVGTRLLFRSFRAHRARTITSSRIVAGVYCLALVLVSLYFMVLLFTPIV